MHELFSLPFLSLALSFIFFSAFCSGLFAFQRSQSGLFSFLYLQLSDKKGRLHFAILAQLSALLMAFVLHLFPNSLPFYSLALSLLIVQLASLYFLIYYFLSLLTQEGAFVHLKAPEQNLIDSFTDQAFIALQQSAFNSAIKNLEAAYHIALSVDDSHSILYFSERLSAFAALSLEKRAHFLLIDLISLYCALILAGVKTGQEVSFALLQQIKNVLAHCQQLHLKEAQTKIELALQSVIEQLLEMPEGKDCIQFILELLSFLEHLAKERFRQDKEIDIAWLAEPFRQLAAALAPLLSKEKGEDWHPVDKELQRILAELLALQEVMLYQPPKKKTRKMPQVTET